MLHEHSPKVSRRAFCNFLNRRAHTIISLNLKKTWCDLTEDFRIISVIVYNGKEYLLAGEFVRCALNIYGDRELCKYCTNTHGEIEVQGKDEKDQEQAGIVGQGRASVIIRINLLTPS